MRSTKKARVLEYAAGRGWTVIGAAEWNELVNSLPDISERTLRTSGLAIAQPWKGVEQHSPEQLEASLVELQEVYETRPDLRKYCREQVIQAKDRARWIARDSRVAGARRELKAEMVEWMLVWLDDPAMFHGWVQARRSALMVAMPEHTMEEHRVKCDVCGGSGQCTVCKGTGNGGQCFNCAGTGNCPQCQGTGRRAVEKIK